MQTSSNASLDVYSEAVHLLLATLEKADPHRLMVALTSIHSGEGVTYTTLQVAEAIRRVSPLRIKCIDLASLDAGSGTLSEQVTSSRSPSPLKAEGPVPEPKVNRAEQMTRSLRLHSAQSDVLLVDCPALSRSGEALAIATVVHGYIVVLQAGRIRREQITNVERMIVDSGGRIFGFILNRAS